ncbi:MAG: InlB B-repeat-containing protein [Clostridia bacterium]|nr:InlB B-repeat-containing protein [Clostridia bacterium]
MKKRLVIALTLILVLVFTMGSLVGCDEIFKRNEERDAKQIVATVNYAGQTGYVTKGELISSFNAYAYSYVYYYGMTYQQAADYILKSLAQRELLVLFAKEYIFNAYKEKGLIASDAALETVKIEELLTRSELNKAIEDTNHDMLHSLSSIIDGLYTDDVYNEGKNDEEDEEVEITDPVKVKFETFDGSAVEAQKIQKGTKADEPTAPTLANKSFYGWYTEDGSESGEYGEKFDFDTKVEENITLYAKWVDYRAPRAEKPEEAEEDDYDADLDDESIELEAKFFEEEFINAIKSKEEELEIELNIADEEFNQYIDRGIAKLQENLKSNFHDYDYYLDSQMKTILIEKLERYVGNLVDVDKAAVEERFNKLVDDNREAFSVSDSAFASALSSARATTYFHKYTVNENNSGYGYVVNILLKLNQEDTDYLAGLVNAGTIPTENIIEIRNQKISEMMVAVSNPNYDADAEVDYNKDEKVDSADKEIAEKMIDPMTDPSNPYNVAGTKYNADNDYNNLVKFGKNADGEWEITYGAVECPTMAYLLNEVPAFSTGEQVGIIDQIYNSFESVKQAVADGEMTHVESIYWLNQVATAWVYIVGDDTGMTTASSNNGGLGYLITPEGEDSSYLANFTDLARDLIKNGTGSYSVDGTATEGNFYTIADSFIENRNTSNAYAGIFVLLCSYKAWDNSATGIVENEDGTFSEVEITLEATEDGGVLPMEYIVSYGKTLEDCITVGEQVKSDLEAGIKSDKYSQVANEFGLANTENIEYHEDIYKSLWKDLE